MRKGGFTLVELIVTIWILSILWTISFISVQWYSSDSRNTKRLSDISNISTKIEIDMIQWLSIFSFVEWTWSTIKNNISISWNTWTTLNWRYVAWDINYKSLNANPDDFKDPSKDIWYKIWVTSIWNKYEVSASYEDGNNSYAIVRWNWNPRKSAETRWNRDWDHVDSTNKYKIIENIENTWLRLWDLVKFWSDETAFKILKMNWNEITVDWIIPAQSSIILHSDETRHLIKRWINSDWAIKTISDWATWNDYTPYNIWK